MTLTSFASCEPTSKQTETTDTQDTEGVVCEKEYVIVPIEIVPPEEIPNRLSFSLPSEIYENKIVIDDIVTSRYRYAEIDRQPVRIRAFDWYDLVKNSDAEYKKIEKKLSSAEIGLGLAIEQYNKYPDRINAQKYIDCLEEYKKAIEEYNNYPQKCQERKLSDLKAHFEGMGIECKTDGEDVLVTVTMEQLLTLADTRFLYFFVCEGDAWSVAE